MPAGTGDFLSPLGLGTIIFSMKIMEKIKVLLAQPEERERGFLGGIPSNYGTGRPGSRSDACSHPYMHPGDFYHPRSLPTHPGASGCPGLLAFEPRQLPVQAFALLRGVGSPSMS